MIKILEWNVYVENFNLKEIRVFNIFEHYYFLNDCITAAKKCADRISFEKEIEKSLQYYYWSKCEWEIVLSDWPPSNKFNDEKVSVFDQIMINWNRFIDYLWENRSELLLKKDSVKHEA